MTTASRPPVADPRCQIPTAAAGTSWLVGEITTYAPMHPAWREPLFWVQMIETLWFFAWFIVWLLVAMGEISFLNMWDGLLVYMIGTALIVIFLQLVFIIYYASSNNAVTGVQAAPVGAHNLIYRNFMGLAHNKELGMGVIVSIISGVATAGIWYDWLCRFKDACTYDSNSANTGVSIAFDTAAHIEEYNSFKTAAIFIVIFSILAVYWLIRSIWAHFRPLRAITHLVQGKPLSTALIMGNMPYAYAPGYAMQN